MSFSYFINVTQINRIKPFPNNTNSMNIQGKVLQFLMYPVYLHRCLIVVRGLYIIRALLEFMFGQNH